MTDDRNLTVHTYNERLAEQIAGRIGKHASLMRVWSERIAERSVDR